MAKSRTLNIVVSDELYEQLKREADEKNVSIASIVRIACSEYLRKSEK
jgi:predicted DNA-binding ribbon-helix-helix protein